MVFNEKQFGIADNGRIYPQAHLDLIDLAGVNSLPDSLRDFNPSTASYEDHMNASKLIQEHKKTNIDPLANRVFEAMERDGVPHHPKLKAQYDRGMITANEYAQEMLGLLGHN
jgi:hypothetical protein